MLRRTAEKTIVEMETTIFALSNRSTNDSSIIFFHLFNHFFSIERSQKKKKKNEVKFVTSILSKI